MIRVGLECDAGETSRCPFPRTRAPRHLAGPSGRFLAGQGAPRGRVVFVDLRAKVGAAQAVSAWTQSHDADHRDPGLPHLRQSPRGQRLHVSPAGDRLSTPQVVLRGQPCLRRSHTRETVASWQPPTRKGQSWRSGKSHASWCSAATGLHAGWSSEDLSSSIGSVPGTPAGKLHRDREQRRTDLPGHE